MCGIAGQVRTDGQPVRTELLSAMSARLEHRGPDDSGMYVHGPAGLVHRRLSILDRSAAGRQPMSSGRRGADAPWIVCNGEIYNFRELRRALRAPREARSGTDTEVLLHLFEDFGLDCLPMLRGMFAFAVWEPAARRLVLAKDRVGKKPLYYRVGADHLTFASRVDALCVASDLPPIDPVALHHYLSFQYVPAPRTGFQGIRKLRPGHLLVYEDGVVSERAWSSVRFEPKAPPRPEAEWVEQFRSLFDEAVRLRLVADVPVGAFLSGGLDSSAVVEAMGRLARRPVQTFGVGFEEPEFDERPWARDVAKRLGTEHHELVLGPSCLDALPDVVRAYDEPYGDSSAIATWHLSRFSRSSVTVALNGDGADELLAGYPRYQLPASARAMDRLPGRAVAATHRLLTSVPGARARVAPWLQSTPAWYAERITIVPPALKRRLYTPEFARAVVCADAESLVRDWFMDAHASDALDGVLAVDVRSYLPDDLLTKVDRATMAHALEARSPFLDGALVDFAATLPADLKLRGREGKYLLKAAMRGVLPEHLVHRPKHGFGVPVTRWLSTHHRDLVRDVLLSSRSTGRGYFEPRRIEALVAAHERGEDRHRGLYLLLMLELWHREYVDGRARGARA